MEDGLQANYHHGLSGTDYHAGRQEVIVAPITSNVARLPGDHLVKDWQGAGLPRPSVTTGILRTIKQSMIERPLGKMPARDLRAFEQLLRATLGL